MNTTAQGTVQMTEQDCQNATAENKKNNEGRVEDSVAILEANPFVEARFLHPYTGEDEYQTVEAKDDMVYSLLTDVDVEKLRQGSLVVPSFLHLRGRWSVLPILTPIQEKVFDTKALSQALQIAPYYNEDDERYEYKRNLVAFKIDRTKLVDGKFIAAGGICQAQSQLGCGGGEQIVLSAQDSKTAQDIGLVVFNEQDSIIGLKEGDYVLSRKEARKIEKAIKERTKHCLVHKTKSHDTTKEFKHGFTVGEYASAYIFNYEAQLAEDKAALEKTAEKLNALDVKAMGLGREEAEKTKGKSIDILEPLSNRHSRLWTEYNYEQAYKYAETAMITKIDGKRISPEDLQKDFVQKIQEIDRSSNRESVPLSIQMAHEKREAMKQIKRGEVTPLSQKWQKILAQSQAKKYKNQTRNLGEGLEK